MGCFTSSITAFANRPWEVKIKLTVTLAPYLQRVIMELIGSKVVRILPYVDDREWISNKTRINEKEPIAIESNVNIGIHQENIGVISMENKKTSIMLRKRLSETSNILFKVIEKTERIGLVVNTALDMKESSIIRPWAMLLKAYIYNIQEN